MQLRLSSLKDLLVPVTLASIVAMLGDLILCALIPAGYFAAISFCLERHRFPLQPVHQVPKVGEGGLKHAQQQQPRKDNALHGSLHICLLVMMMLAKWSLLAMPQGNHCATLVHSPHTNQKHQQHTSFRMHSIDTAALLQLS